MKIIDELSKTGLRQCSKCGLHKPEAPQFFHRSTDGRNGLRAYCIECARTASLEWRNANLERARENYRAWYRRNSERVIARVRASFAAKPDAKHEYDRTRYWADPERHRARSRRTRAANPGDRRVAHREWRLRNPEAWAALCHARRARKKGAEGRFTAADFRRICVDQQGRCRYCLKVRKLTVDHKTPLTRGGSNWPDNIGGACLSCNSKKHDLTEAEFLAVLKARQ